MASQRQAADFAPAARGYEELTKKTTEFVSKQVADNGIAPERVARQIGRAVESRNPKARYLLPASSKMLVGVMTRLPDGAADRAKRLAAR